MESDSSFKEQKLQDLIADSNIFKKKKRSNNNSIKFNVNFKENIEEKIRVEGKGEY